MLLLLRAGIRSSSQSPLSCEVSVPPTRQTPSHLTSSTHMKAVTQAGRGCRGDRLAQDRQSLASYLNSSYGAGLGEAVAEQIHGAYCLASFARGVLQHTRATTAFH